MPASKSFNLTEITFSGDNRAFFYVELNGTDIELIRTWWMNFNEKIIFNEFNLVTSDELKIYVENKGTDAVDFNSTIRGLEYDD